MVRRVRRYGILVLVLAMVGGFFPPFGSGGPGDIGSMSTAQAAPYAGSYTVDTTADDASLNACTPAANDCSLRGAIGNANGAAGYDAILFDIPAASCPGGICTITLTEGPISITDETLVDGTTQPQNDGPQSNVCATPTAPSHMRIQVLANPTVNTDNTFVIANVTGTTTIRGLALGTERTPVFFNGAIRINAGTGHKVQCMHIGVDAAGTAQLGASEYSAAVTVEGTASGIIVGTDGDGTGDVGERNVIGTATTGVYINGNNDNVVAGNYIGVGADGTADVGPIMEAVYMRQSSSGNRVGSDGNSVSDEAERNFIGNAAYGVLIEPLSSGQTMVGNLIFGNTIGLTPTGQAAGVANGVVIRDLEATSTGNQIARNTIGGATTAIRATASSATVAIYDNVLGTDTTRTSPFPNTTGISLGQSGLYRVHDNVVANSTSVGISLADSAAFTADSQNNCVIGNAAGVQNGTGSIVPFEYNWWGDPSGPSGVGPGSGDSVSANVDYDPWDTVHPDLCDAAPVADDALFTIPEDAAVGAVVGTVSAHDSDDGALTFTITGGNNGGAFAIGADTGTITVASALDYESVPSYTLTVEASDGVLADTATITIGVEDVFEVPAAPTFVDVPLSHTFFEDVEWLAWAGVTLGCDTNGPRYCPTDPVTRAQMASFLARALGLSPVPGDRFADVSGVHEGNINAIADAGITLGCNADGTLYCPDAFVTRGQMAAFLHRGLG